MGQEDSGLVSMRAVLLAEFDLQKIYLVATDTAKAVGCAFGGISLYELPTTPPSLADCLTFTLSEEKVDALAQSLLDGLEADRSSVRFTVAPLNQAGLAAAGRQRSELYARLRAYVRTNWGSPFVMGFMVLLVAAAAELSAGASGIANAIAIYAFYSLVLGVVLQIASYVKYGEGGAEVKPAPEKKAVSKARARPTRRVLTVILVVALLATASMLAASGLIFPSTASSACRGARNDGTLFISSTQTVTIKVCGQSYVVKAGTGGGMTYAYHSGVVSLSAPASVNGTQFKAWYAVLNGNPQAPIGNRTYDLSLPAGLSAQSSSLEVFYTGQDPSAASPAVTSSASSASASSSVGVSSTSTSSSASSSGSTSTTSSAASSSSSSTTTSSSSSTSTAAGGCQGGDGQVFLSTNLDGLVPVEVCGQQVELQGGPGGGLDYAYHAGQLALQAPQTVGGATFEYWYIAFPGFHEQVRNSSVVVQAPAGLTPRSAIIIAFYG